MSPSKHMRPLDGVVWPLVPNSKKEGDRSTTWANKEAFAAAIGAVDPTLAKKLRDEKAWRQNYTKYVYKHVASCLSTRQAAVESAKAGLEWVHNNFEFIRDGNPMTMAEAMSSISGTFETGVLKGSKPKPTTTVLQEPEMPTQVDWFLRRNILHTNGDDRGIWRENMSHHSGNSFTILVAPKESFPYPGWWSKLGNIVAYPPPEPLV